MDQTNSESIVNDLRVRVSALEGNTEIKRLQRENANEFKRSEEIKAFLGPLCGWALAEDPARIATWTWWQGVKRSFEILEAKLAAAEAALTYGAHTSEILALIKQARQGAQHGTYREYWATLQRMVEAAIDDAKTEVKA